MNGRLKSNNFLREKHAASGGLLDLKTFVLLPRKKEKERNYEKIKKSNRYQQKVGFEICCWN